MKDTLKAAYHVFLIAVILTASITIGRLIYLKGYNDGLSYSIELFKK